MRGRLEAIWYGGDPLGLPLIPLSWLFCGVALARRAAYQSGLLTVRRLDVPVLVVGNITAGGTGKTPLVVWLVDFLRGHGFRPGVVCRGYGGTSREWPRRVEPDSVPGDVGDEAVLVARRARCPISAAPDRVAAAEALLEGGECDVIVSDDGLQHLALGRDVEVAVVDGERRHGNGRCIPAGPLREPVGRLGQVDAVVANGRAARGEYRMRLVPDAPRRVMDDRVGDESLEAPSGRVHGVAGIGNPGRFFSSLRSLGHEVVPHPFPDHHAFAPEDLRFGDARPVLMTEKDAVKCRAFAGPTHWYVPVKAELHPAFGRRVLELLERYRDG